MKLAKTLRSIKMIALIMFACGIAILVACGEPRPVEACDNFSAPEDFDIEVSVRGPDLAADYSFRIAGPDYHLVATGTFDGAGSRSSFEFIEVEGAMYSRENEGEWIVSDNIPPGLFVNEYVLCPDLTQTSMVRAGKEIIGDTATVRFTKKQSHSQGSGYDDIEETTDYWVNYNGLLVKMRRISLYPEVIDSSEGSDGSPRQAKFEMVAFVSNVGEPNVVTDPLATPMIEDAEATALDPAKPDSEALDLVRAACTKSESTRDYDIRMEVEVTNDNELERSRVIEVRVSGKDYEVVNTPSRGSIKEVVRVDSTGYYRRRPGAWTTTTRTSSEAYPYREYLCPDLKQVSEMGQETLSSGPATRYATDPFVVSEYVTEGLKQTKTETWEFWVDQTGRLVQTRSNSTTISQLSTERRTNRANWEAISHISDFGEPNDIVAPEVGTP